MVNKKLVCLVLVNFLILLSGTAGAKKVNKSNTNETIKKLQEEIDLLRAENMRLKVMNQKLNMTIQNLEKWDCRKLMDELKIYRLTTHGKEYDLFFFEGGLGGVSVYQYVGPNLGDAGVYRQYKQIAELKTSEMKHGYIKPGVVIRPVWGFNESNVTIHSISQLIQIEHKLNSIHGLALYFHWVRTQYLKSSNYSFGTMAVAVGIVTFIGAVVGEVYQPIDRIRRGVALRSFTYWGEDRRKGLKKAIIGTVWLILAIILFGSTPIPVALAMSALVGFMLYKLYTML